MNRIRELRKSNKLTQKQFCKILNIAQPTLSGYETNNFQPDNATLVKIADYFGVPLDHLFDRKVQIREELQPLSEHNLEICCLNNLIKEKERTIDILLKLRKRHG